MPSTAGSMMNAAAAIYGSNHTGVGISSVMSQTTPNVVGGSWFDAAAVAAAAASNQLGNENDLIK